MASIGADKDFKMTRDELDRISEAMKKKEFRDLLVDYAKEITDPENRKIREQEIAALEMEQGNDVKFLHPNPGYVLKSVDKKTDNKVFINICQNDLIDKASCSKGKKDNGQSGSSWSVPHSCSHPHEDVDSKRVKCKTVDVVFHPNTVYMAQKDIRFRDMIQKIAFDALLKNFGIEVDTQKVKKIKLNFKGTPQATIIRNKIGANHGEEKMTSSKSPLDSKIASIVKETKAPDNVLPANLTKGRDDESREKPNYTVLYRNSMDISDCAKEHDIRTAASNQPKEMEVRIDLPKVSSPAETDLKVHEKRIELSSKDYFLDLKLSYAVDETNGSAKWDKKLKRLNVKLPILPAKVELPVSPASSLVSEIVDDGVKESATTPEVPSRHASGDRISLDSGIEDIEASPLNKDTAPSDTEEIPSIPSKILLLKPDLLECCDDNPHIHFVFNLRNDPKSMSLCEAKVEGDAFKVTLTSGCGQGGFPMKFGCVIATPSTEASFNLDVPGVFAPLSRDKVRLTLTKSSGSWDTVKFGDCVSSLEVRELVPLDKSTFDHSLVAPAVPKLILEAQSTDKLDSDDEDNEEEEEAENEDATEVPDCDSETQCNVKIVTSPPPADLAGILKRPGRGRTRSVDSDSSGLPPLDADNSSKSTSGTGQTTGPVKSRRVRSATWSDDTNDGTPAQRRAAEEYFYEDQPEEGDDDDDAVDDEDGQGRERRKSVSFNDKIETTTYRCKDPATALHKTIKNKRKRQRKYGEKKERKEEAAARRRRNSSGGSSNGDTTDDTVSPRSPRPSDGGSGDATFRHHHRPCQAVLEASKNDVVFDENAPDAMPPLEAQSSNNSSLPGIKEEDVGGGEEEPCFQPETLLSWKEQTEAQKQKYRTRCPFEFETEAMFEADVD